jgi:ankyrin repeat protein
MGSELQLEVNDQLPDATGGKKMITKRTIAITLLLAVLLAALPACSSRKKGPPTTVTPSVVEMFYQAAKRGDTGRVEYLLTSLPDLINAKEKDYGLTALHAAVAADQLAMVQYLLTWRGPNEQKADVEAKSRSGNTPLIEAVAYNRMAVAAYLLDQAHADVNDKNNSGETPLHWAAAKGYLDMVKLLLTHHADIAAATKDDQTPLHFAAQEGRTDVVALLLDRGAKVNVRDSHERTPLRLARIRHHPETADLLKKKGGEI